MRRLALAITVAAICLLPACFAPTEPLLGSDLLLTGNWVWNPYTPGGDGATLSTRAGGGEVAGEWREFRLGALSASATVSGSYDTSGAFTMRLKYSTGGAAGFAGNVIGADFLNGDWTDSARKLVVYHQFSRSLPPPCADTLPVLGKYYPPLAPLYFVGFRRAVDALTEATRLAGRYGFAVVQVHMSAPKGLSAQLTAGQLMVLQCETSVDSIAYTTWPVGIAASARPVARGREVP